MSDPPLRGRTARNVAARTGPPSIRVRRRASEQQAKAHLSVRLEDDETERVKAVMSDISTEWYPATISDTLRALIFAGLVVYEAKRKPPEPRRARGRKHR